MRNYFLAGVTALFALATVSQGYVHDFDAGFTPGPIGGQNGWVENQSGQFNIVAGNGIGGTQALSPVYTMSWSKAIIDSVITPFEVDKPVITTADFQINNGPIVESGSGAFFNFIIAANGNAPVAERLVVSLNRVPSNNTFQVYNQQTTNPLAEPETMSEWFRLQVSLTKQANSASDILIENTLYSLGPDGTGEATMLDEWSSMWSNSVMYGNANLAMTLSKGDTNSPPHGTIYIDGLTFGEPQVIPSSPVVLTGTQVIESKLFSVNGELILETTDDLGNPWTLVPGQSTAPDDGVARFYDLNPSGGDMAVYRVNEFVPLVFFEDNFDGADMGWTATANNFTTWEQGPPNIQNAFLTLTEAASAPNCWGTDLDWEYNADTVTTLTSPVIDLSAATESATLVYKEVRDIDPSPSLPAGDRGVITLIDITAGNTTTEIHATNGEGHDWTEVSIPIPASALGHQIQLEFKFVSDSDPSPGWTGWYIDDVMIAE